MGELYDKERTVNLSALKILDQQSSRGSLEAEAHT